MKYRFDEFKYYDGDKDLIIIMEDKRYQIISTFLQSEGNIFQNHVCVALDKVLNGESKYEELNGNVCGVEINKDITQIYDNLAEDGMGNWCEVETKELRVLVDIWFKELKKFKSKNKDNSRL